jgi:DNA-directed RNA polymerase sigma subunit (sigma70/sigma32)
MKHYNIDNYVRYKKDVEKTIKSIPHKEFHEYTQDELITTFLPLVENLARKFATSQQASGVMDITDLIQEGSYSLIRAVNKVDWQVVKDSDDPEKTIKSFFSKRELKVEYVGLSILIEVV